MTTEVQNAMNATLWPAFAGPEDLPAVEQVPLEHRGLPSSTYELVVRAAKLWPDRPAVTTLADAERYEHPSTRTFAELATDVHRAAHVLSGLGITRRDAVALVSVNSEQLHTALLAAEAVGIAAPINPGLSPSTPRSSSSWPARASSSPPGPSSTRRLGSSDDVSPRRPAHARCLPCGPPQRPALPRPSSRSTA